MDEKEKRGAGAWKRLIERMKADKKFEAAVYIALLLIGLLVYLLLPESTAPQKRGETDTESSARSEVSVERQLEETLCHMRGVGDVKVMLSYAENGREEVYGVIVLARGAEDIMVRTRIESAVQTVLRVDAARINVFEMEDIAEVK